MEEEKMASGGVGGSSENSIGERIIPITILSSKHKKNDENDNKADNNAAQWDIDFFHVLCGMNSSETYKRLSMPTPLSPNNNSGNAGAALDNNSSSTLDDGAKRHSLLVTLDDGTTTETQGSVTRLHSHQHHPSKDSPLSIQEIGQDTLRREILNSSQQPSGNVRRVPIKLLDGKVIQHQPPEESMQMRAEFTNFTHQEFADEEESAKAIPRLDMTTNTGGEEVKNERIVPITLLDSGVTIMPTFTKLEDPQPPDWSTFSKLNKAKEREVPLTQQQQSDDQTPSSASEERPGAGESRGRERTKPPITPPGRSGSASKGKNSVRFDLNDQERSSSMKSERRSSSMETFSRTTTTTTTTKTSAAKPPAMPPKTKSKLHNRPSSMERPASAMATISPTTERTLQEIDRDINQIWRELQELEKLPNGTYKPRSSTATPPAAAAGLVTPVRVKATYTPSACVPKVVNTGSTDVTPNPSRRTIWDMDSSSKVSKSTPVTPNLSKKMESPPPPLPSVSRLPPPPIPPHLRPQQIKMAPIARDESFYDIASKSPSTASCYDNEYSPASGKFKGFPYIDGAPRDPKRSHSPSKQVEQQQNNNFSLLVDKSTQTPQEAAAAALQNSNSPSELEKRNGGSRAKDACAIL